MQVDLSRFHFTLIRWLINNRWEARERKVDIERVKEQIDASCTQIIIFVCGRCWEEEKNRLKMAKHTANKLKRHFSLSNPTQLQSKAEDHKNMYVNGDRLMKKREEDGTMKLKQ